MNLQNKFRTARLSDLMLIAAKQSNRHQTESAFARFLRIKEAYVTQLSLDTDTQRDLQETQQWLVATGRIGKPLKA